MNRLMSEQIALVVDQGCLDYGIPGHPPTAQLHWRRGRQVSDVRPFSTGTSRGSSQPRERCVAICPPGPRGLSSTSTG